MIHEIRTTVLKPGGVQELERHMAGALADRARLSPLGAWWHTEIGTLSRVVEVWPYADLAERDRVQTALAPDPTRLGLAISELVEIWEPAPFMRALEPRAYGGIFEMRTYTFRPGTLPLVLEVWAKAVPERERLSPLVACWTTRIGAMHRLRHVWAYRDLEERARIRAEALALPLWPPPTREWRIAEENEILLPAPFSPIR